MNHRPIKRRKAHAKSMKNCRLLVLCSWVSVTSGFAPSITLRRNHHARDGRPTTQRFVLTTPEAIIEQASTTKLLDDLIDESVRTSARRPIMMQFDPRSGWIWKRWKGTVFSETWDACVYRMIYASAVFILCRSFPHIKDTLSGFSILWGQLLSVTTFTLTFFVNQSYALWRKCSDCSRSLQGRLHDMDMTLAAHAARIPPTGFNQPSTYTPEARQMLELVSRYVRLFNLLTYASFTRSHRPVLTPRGMRRLVERGLMTPLEREVLINAAIPATQRHNAVLLWIIRAFIEGTDAGHFKGGDGFEQQFIEKAHVCRSAYGSIGDELQGRMPLAYAHIVQVLVDLVLVLYPFMAFSSGMSGFVCVLGTGILTIGYQGLFDLAKQFLDPYDNENYGKGEDPLVVDTLIAETNAGSVRWMYGLAEMPLSPIKVQDGDLSDYLLPLRGYSVDELKQRQEEKQALQEKREKEEIERLRKEEQEQAMRLAAESMIPYLVDDSGSSLPNESLAITYADDAVKLPAIRHSSSYKIAEMVNSATFSQNSNATSLQLALIPKGTAPAILYEKASVPLVEAQPLENVVNGDLPFELTPDGNEASYSALEVVVNGNVTEFANIEDETTVIDAVHQEVENDPSGDVTIEQSSSDPTSESLASETTESSVVPDDTLATGTLSIADYERQVIEILEAEKAELLETQAILNAPPAAEGIEELEKDDDTISIAPIGNSTTVVEQQELDQVLDAVERVSEGDESGALVDFTIPDSAVFNGTVIDLPPPLDDPMTAADYEKQFQVIIQAVNEERLETQAILNAPPAAEVIPVLEKDQTLLPVLLNVTGDLDELSVLEMDEPLVPVDDAPMDDADSSAPENADAVNVGAELKSPLDVTDEAMVEEVNGAKPVR